ncbi:MAG: hypothetical protein AB7O65_02130 [Candidatus Korobacteraceae bacterium]
MTVALLFGARFAARSTAQFLVVDNARPSDAVVIGYGPNEGDELYWEALRLLREEKARWLVLSVDGARYGPGPSDAERAVHFVGVTANDLRKFVRVCPESGESEFALAECLDELNVRRVLLVASAQNSRLAYGTYTRDLGQYSWSVAAVPDPARFGRDWWRNRRWAATYMKTWHQLLQQVVQ